MSTTRIPTKGAMKISDQTFDDWVHEYNRLLFGLAYWWTGSCTDAEKLTQEAFLQAYRSRQCLRDEAAVKSWLVGILCHCHSQMCRKPSWRDEISLEELLVDPADQNIFDPEAIALRQALGKLDEKHRLAVVMFYFHELSYREIADSLELPLGTVVSRLSRARKALVELLDTNRRSSVVQEVDGI
jgi:RNA polymerase sigma-70 factor, ECF subfamily